MASSPFPEGAGTVRLEVRPGSDLAEVFLVDHAFGLVDRSVGVLVAHVEPGVYNVKARLGEATTEQLVVLTEDTLVDVSRRLEVASPAPILGTSQTHEYHMEAAREESGQVVHHLGDGATIFLMTRRFTREGAPAARGPSELSLRTPGGELLADLHELGRGIAGTPDPSLGLTVSVDPGGYLLRWSGSTGAAVEQSVHAVEGWQTQMFLLEEADHDGRHRVSVLMSKEPFDPYRGDLREVEEARSALADERRVASAAISEALFAKFDNPMLGLFGAHLMLIADEAVHEAADAERRAQGAKRRRAPVQFEQGRFDGAVHNLRAILGAGHPDVIALSTRTAGRSLDELAPVTVPPMLWRSWVLLLRASNRAPHLVPASTWWPTVQQVPLRPFLVWSPDPDPARSRHEWAHAISSALARTTARDDVDVRERLSRRMLVPRAAIDELGGS